MVTGAGAPAVLAACELCKRALRKERHASGLDRVAQGARDRKARAVADLEQTLARRSAAAGEPIAAVFSRELDAELLEPVDRGGRLGGEHLDEPQVCGLVARGSVIYVAFAVVQNIFLPRLAPDRIELRE